MKIKEKLLQSLETFKQSSKNAGDKFEIIKHIVRNRNIDSRLKLRLINIIPAFVQTDLFTKEAIQNFVESINMKIDTKENDILLFGNDGYQIQLFSRDENNILNISNYIAINKKGGVRTDVITHESVHGLAQNFQIGYENGYLEYNSGFRNKYFDRDLKLVGAVGTAFNEGFTEVVTSKVLDETRAGKVRKKIKKVRRGMKGTRYHIQGKTFNKNAETQERDRVRNPYGFKYDDFDNKYGGGDYTVYKKMAELLNFASDGKALEYFTKGDLYGFTKEFDSVGGEDSFRKLLSTLDYYEIRYRILMKKRFNDEMKLADLYKDRNLMQIVSNCTNEIVEYFSKNVGKQLYTNMSAADLVEKLTEFEKMLPKSVNRLFWDNKKNILLRSFAILKMRCTTRKKDKMHFAALDIYYSDCLKDENCLNKNFDFQSMPNPQKPHESILIINNDDKARIFSVDLIRNFDSDMYDEILTEDLNTKKILTRDECTLKEKLDESLSVQTENNDKENLKYLTCSYYKDLVFVSTKEGVSVYSISKKDNDMKLEKVQLNESAKIAEDKIHSETHNNDPEKLGYFKNIRILHQKFEERFKGSKER